MTINNQINKWNDFYYKVESHIVTDNQITLALDSFKVQELLPLLELYIKDKDLKSIENIKNLIDNFKLLIIFKIKTNNQQIRTISYMQTLGIGEFNQLYEIFSEYWNLKTETIKYCDLDCVVLYQVINKFSDLIFKMFRIDLLKYSTLSSLAFAIFRTSFLKESKIPLIHGEMYEFIKKSYTGGSVDVYKPKPSSNKKVYRYDVNSLYPYAMKQYPMPVNDPTYFEGDILQNYDPENKPFGIFEVYIIAPSQIKYPLLQQRVKTGKFKFPRTVACIGSWTGVYLSDELLLLSKVKLS